MRTKLFNVLSTQQKPQEGLVRQYIEQIINYVEANSIRPKNERDKFASELREKTKNSATHESTYPAIRNALHELQDNHSFLCETRDWTSHVEARHEMPGGEVVNGMAVIKVPGFPGDGAMCHDYVDHCHRLIESLDARNPRGWIIDLRGNPGGHSFAMLAGLGPLFEERTPLQNGKLGSFAMRNGNENFGYANGAGWSEENGGHAAIASLSDPQKAYHLKKPEPSVAILMGPQTASAGETIAVAALGCKPRMQIFGAESAGQTTGNGPIRNLNHNGAQIFIAQSTQADRNGKEYGYSLLPDIEIPESGPDDPVPPRALQWLTEQAQASNTKRQNSFAARFAP